MTFSEKHKYENVDLHPTQLAGRAAAGDRTLLMATISPKDKQQQQHGLGAYAAAKEGMEHQKYTPMTLVERMGPELCADGGGEDLKQALFELYKV